MVYKITLYSYKKAEENDLNIVPSTKKNKKIHVYKNGEYITSIGDVRYNDYPTYIKNDGKKYADERRRLYHIRHKTDNKVGTKGWYALNILW